MAEGYSIKGSQANSVDLNPGGTFSGGKRFSVSGPTFDFSWPRTGKATDQAKTVSRTMRDARCTKAPFACADSGSLATGSSSASVTQSFRESRPHRAQAAPDDGSDRSA